MLTSTPRCDIDGLYSCVHKTPEDRVQTVIIGDELGSKLEDISGTATSMTKEEPKYRIANLDEKTIICSRCDKAVPALNYCSLCGYSLHAFTKNSRVVLPEKTQTTTEPNASVQRPSSERRKTGYTEWCVHCKKTVEVFSERWENGGYEGRSCSKCLRLFYPPITNDTTQTQTTVSEKPTQTADDKITKCSYCQKEVVIKYIDAHLKTHLMSCVRGSLDTTSSSTSIDATSKPKIDPKRFITSEKTEKANINLKSLEHFEFRKIENVSAESFVSKDGRFSDFNVIIWLKDKYSINNNTYAGAAWAGSKDCERILIGITFDKIDDYCSVSVKLIKQYTHSSWDTEETVPEKLCFDQTEISQEIKRALIFLRIPPKAVYKRFRKLMKTQSFHIEYDKQGNAISCSTTNTKDLIAHLKEKKSVEVKDDNDDNYYMNMYS